MPHRIIGIICSSEGWGGLELNTLRLSGWLRAEGWKVHLLTSGGAPIAVNVDDRCNSVTAFAESGKPARGGQLRVVHRWAQRYKIKALLVPYNKDIAVASLYKRFYNRDIAFVYQQHMQVGVRKRDLIHTLRYAMIDAWISPLQYLKDETLRLTRVPEEKISVIPFGIDTERFLHSGWTRESARAALSLSQDAHIIGLLGRLDPGKGQDVIVHALKQLHDEGKRYELLIMGSATLNEAGAQFEQELRQFTVDAGLQDAVHFRPFSDDVMCFFRAIDVFAMPAPGETFGMVTIEAMAAGVPVIGADKDGTREILGEGRWGTLFQRNDAEDFCRQLKLMQLSPDNREQAMAAQQTAISIYGRQAMIRHIIALLESLIVASELA